MQCKWENSIISRQVYMIRFFFETPLSYDCVSNLECVYSGDIGRWAVRLGRHGLEMVSSPPKGQLRWDRDPP